MGSILDGVIGIFHSRNPSGISLGEGGEDGLCVQLTTLPPSCADCLEIRGASTSRTSKGPVQACTGVSGGGPATLEEIQFWFP